MSSRKNAMLTTEDRRWLTGEKTYDGQHAKQQRYQRRNDIRERVYNSILDFTILFEDLEAEERRKIFGDVIDDGRQWADADGEFRDGVRDAIAFLLRGIGSRELLRDSTAAPTVPELVLEMALARAGQRDGFLVDDVAIDVEATEVAVPELLDDLEAGKDISAAELYLLMESGAFETAAIRDCLRDQLRDDAEGE